MKTTLRKVSQLATFPVIPQKEALIAWNAREYVREIKQCAPPGAVAVGRLLHKGESDWTRAYEAYGGACWRERRRLFGTPARLAVLLDWHTLVYSYGVNPYIAHVAFLCVREYRDMVAPDDGEPGFDPTQRHGRACQWGLPEIEVHRVHGAIHVWPKQ